MSRRLLYFCYFCSLMFGCDEALDPPLEVTATQSCAINTSVLRPSEDLPLAIATEVAAFAGYYCSGGDLYVGVIGATSPTTESRLRDLVHFADVASRCYTRAVGVRTPQVRLVEKRFSFMQLRSWRDALTEQYFEIPGTQGLGIDYENNRIQLEVRHNSGATEAAAAFASSFGLPSNAFVVTEEPALELTVACPNPSDGYDVSSCFRPIPGGVAMQPMPNGGGSALAGQGTITAAGTRWIPQSNYWQSGFITCAHCVPQTAVNSNDWVSQPNVPAPWDYPNSRVIGVETADPPGWSCGSYVCRYSDAAWITHTAGGVQTGTILQTLGWSGSRIRSTSHPRFYIWGSTTVVQGSQVEKMGTASGWTTGTVVNPCHDALDGLGHKFICNGRTSNYATGGDSGSPVFYWWWFYGVDTVEIVGVLWGYDGQSLYSPWQNIKNDLGDLNVIYPYF